MESRRHPAEPAAPPAAAAFRTDPAQGRLYTTVRTVRSTDVTPAGRLRFDALARYLQQAAEDDLADAGGTMPYTWLVRRVALRIRGFRARSCLVAGHQVRRNSSSSQGSTSVSAVSRTS